MATDESLPRMRLGTKSCAECRRRKVKCVFKDESTVCEGCALHHVTCRPQQPQARLNKRTSPTSDADAMQARMAQLEHMVQRLQANPAQADIRPDVDYPTPEEGYDASVVVGNNPIFCAAPLPSLWKGVMSIEQNQNDVDYSLPNRELNERRLNHAAPPPILSQRSLDILLSETEIFWPIWPSCTFGTDQKVLLTGHRSHNVDIIQDALLGGNPILEVKALLWIMLCLSNFPPWRDPELQLPRPRKQLVQMFHQYSRRFLGVLDDVRMDELECYSLFWKIYFDAGKPRKAWQTLRFAVSAAIQLGLHRVSEHKDERKTAFWNTLWQRERQLSLVLGLPASVPNGHPGTLLEDISSENLLAITYHKLCWIVGQIIERDQHNGTANYATTIQLDQDLEELRTTLPASFWDPQSDDKAFVDRYHQEGTRLFFWMVQKHLHMPYMLKGTQNNKYEYSFTRGLEAARGMINAIQVNENIMCEVMDFFAFSGAITLFIGIFARPQSSHTVSTSSDWQLIAATAGYLHRMATMLDCNVAKQGAETLEIIMAACRGSYNVQEDLNVTIPYFGHVRLNCSPRHVARSAAESLEKDASPIDPSPNMTSWSNPSSGTDAAFAQPTIEFSSNEFGQWGTMDLDMNGNELTVDWFNLDSNLMQYDWSQEFSCPGFPPT